MAEVLRSAIIGTGDVAAVHAQVLARIPGVELVAAASPRSAESFCATHQIPQFFSTADELYDVVRPDVVHLCTPPAGHMEQAIAAIRHGAHVIVEKPAALSLQELDEILLEAANHGRECAIVFQQRSGSASARVKELLASGVLGVPKVAVCHTLWYRDAEYYAVPWRGTFTTEGGGTTLSHSIHQIDLLAYLLGEWHAATGQLWRVDRDIETEDTVSGTLQFQNGVVASILGSVVSPRQVSYLRIDTTRVTIELEHLYGHDSGNWRITPLTGSFPEGFSWPSPDIPSGHEDFLRQVYRSLLAGEPLPEITQNPRRSMEIVTAIYASADRGVPLKKTEVDADLLLRGPLRAQPVDTRGGYEN